MVMKPDPIFSSVEEVLGSPPTCPLILMTPQGRVFNQRIAMELAHFDRIGLLCGRYEGVDERIRQHLVTDEISIGDFVLTGGELPAMIVMDAITRHIPGTLGDPDGAMATGDAAASRADRLIDSIVIVAFAFLFGALAETFLRQRRRLLAMGWLMLGLGVTVAITGGANNLCCVLTCAARTCSKMLTYPKKTLFYWKKLSAKLNSKYSIKFLKRSNLAFV